MSEPLLVATACVAAWLTGHLLIRSRQPERDAVEQLAVGAVAGAAVLLSVGLVLTRLGQFAALPLCVVQLSLATALLMLRRRRRGPGPVGRAAGVSSLVLVLLVPVVLYYGTPVFDTRLEARDPGVYRLAALRLARAGSLVYRDPVVAELSDRSRDHFFPAGSALSPARSMGFYFLDRDEGLVTPQFMPGMMVWLGLGALADGNRGASIALIVLACLVAVAMFVLARRLLAWPFGLLAAVWLAMSLAQSWFVRYGTAEVLAQALLLAGCVFLLQHRDGDDALVGLLAGWSIGLLPLIKIELFVLIVPASVLFLADCATGRHERRAWWSTWVGALAALLLFFEYAYSSAKPYVHDVLLNPGWTLPGFTIATAAGVAALAAARLAARWWPRGGRRAVRELLDRGNRPGVLLRGALIALLAILAAHAYWIRPLGPGWESHNLVILGWVTSELGLALAVIGLCAWLWDRGDSRAAGVVLLLLVPVALQVLWRKQINPELLWAYRRYLPVVLPLAFLSAAYGLHRLWLLGVRSRSPGRLDGFRVASVLAVLLLAGTVTTVIAGRAEFYENHRELVDSGPMVRDLRRVLPPEAVVLFEPRTKRGLLRLEGGIEHAVGRPVIRLPSPAVDQARLQDLLLSQSRAGRDVYLMTTGYLEAPYWLRAEPVEGFLFETARLEERFEALPRETERVAIIVKLYRLRRGSETAPLPGELDVGGWDDLYLDGTRVYQTEGRPGQLSYRRVSAEGGFWLPGLSGAHDTLRLTLAGGLPSTPVTVSLDGVSLETIEVRRGWRDYVLEIPGGWEPADVPHLVLRSEASFMAAEVGSPEDRRELGVAVDRIRWTSSR